MKNTPAIYKAVFICCLLLLLVEPLVHKHGQFHFEEWFGFHGFFGFVACVGLVLAAKVLRRWLKRPENYYDRH